MKEFSNDIGRQMYIDLIKRVLIASVYDESAWTIVRVDKLPSILNPIRFIRKLIQKIILATYRLKSILLIKVRPYNAKIEMKGLIGLYLDIAWWVKREWTIYNFVLNPY